MRAHIESLPDGRYSFEAPMDSDGIRDEPLWVRLDLEVKGSDLYLDFSRSSPPCRGPMNTPFATTKSAVYIGVRHVFPDVPLNAGGFEPIHIKERERHVPARRVSEAGGGRRGRMLAARRRDRARRTRPRAAGARVRRALRHRRQLQSRRLRSQAPAPLRHVLLQRRRLWRVLGGRRPHQRLRDHRIHADAALRGARVALSGAVRGGGAARRLGGRGTVPRRLRHSVSREAASRRGGRGVHDGPRSLPAVRARRRQDRRDDGDPGVAGRAGDFAAACLQGHGLHAGARRLGRREDARRRRLGRSAHA